MTLALALLAGVLALIELARSRGTALIAYAVLALALIVLLPQL